MHKKDEYHDNIKAPLKHFIYAKAQRQPKTNYSIAASQELVLPSGNANAVSTRTVGRHLNSCNIANVHYYLVPILMLHNIYKMCGRQQAQKTKLRRSIKQ